MQSNKDSNGGKTHPSKSSGDSRKTAASPDKKTSANSPVGAPKHGEKKTTP